MFLHQWVLSKFMVNKWLTYLQIQILPKNRYSNKFRNFKKDVQMVMLVLIAILPILLQKWCWMLILDLFLKGNWKRVNCQLQWLLDIVKLIWVPLERLELVWKEQSLFMQVLKVKEIMTIFIIWNLLLILWIVVWNDG